MRLQTPGRRLSGETGNTSAALLLRALIVATFLAVSRLRGRGAGSALHLQATAASGHLATET
ncbi:hypothetical protein EYF80_066728 [Liparis tanakae]|uniref:Uncharacterized protein n=1 Tax=Liparis tanakae TaxID=230148 RepID=A0A4Z2E3C2_9TELE|nr:hypothetical protein EYF80_066728 [Liparis tanakae]